MCYNMSMESKICCFVGHRKLENPEEVAAALAKVVMRLVGQDNVRTFLFGSKSEFDTLSLAIVTECKRHVPEIKRVAYTCKSEGCMLEKDRAKWDRLRSKADMELMETFVDEEFEHKTKYTAGKASHVERNVAMVDASDVCVIYYEPSNPNNGTRRVYEYLQRTKKPFFNIADTLRKE